MNSTRPISLVVALIFLILMGVGHLFVPFAPDAAKIPSVVVYGDVVLGALSLVAAFGLWRLKRWGLIFTLIVLTLNIVSATPGVLEAPNTGLRVVTAAYVILSVVSIVLVALPSTRTVATAQ